MERPPEHNLDACAAVQDVLGGVDLQGYQAMRSIRSSVEVLAEAGGPFGTS